MEFFGVSIEIAARTEGLVDIVSGFENLSGIYGELCGNGIQKNIYKIKNHKVFVFDIKEYGKWVDFTKFFGY